MKIFHIILLTLLCSLSLHAQQGTISGSVTDSLTNQPIEFASARLFNVSDSTFIKGASTNEKGYFNISSHYGNYRLEISFLGYKTLKKYFKTDKDNPRFNLGTIRLSNDSLILDEAIVTAKVPDVVVKGDTIEYNADSYVMDESDLLQDIVRKLPGVELDNEGNLTANGKPITKILVDGKEFFENDIKMALENLPANMIKKLQLFKEQSETSKITGFKDDNEEQVLNLKIKDEYKRNLFGDLRVGYGNKDTYSNRLMANYMHDENQFSVIGNMNNVNNSYSDFGGGFYSPFSGIDKDKDAAGNFAIQRSEKLKLSGNLRYSDNSNLFESKSRTEYFSPSRITQQNSTSTSNRKNWGGGAYTEWKPDSLTTIYFRLSGTYNKNNNVQESENISYAEGKDTTRSVNKNISDGDGNSINGSLVIGRKLNKKGRNVSISLSGIYRKDNSTAFNNSVTTYSSGEDDLVLDQKSYSDSKSNNWGASFSYVEPVSEKNSLMISYSYRQNSSTRDRKTFAKDTLGDYSLLDRNYSRYSESFNSRQNINLSFQSLHEKYEYSIGLNINPAYSKNKMMVEDSIIENIKQKVVDFSPTLRFSYKPKNNISFTANYSGSTNHPSLSQLAKDTIRNSSGTSKTYGNPDLKTSYSNSINLYYQKSDYETGRFLMFSGSANYTFNSIANYTKVDTLWNTETTYKNVNGNWNMNLGATYNTPLRNKKFSIEANSYIFYSQNIGFSNEQKSITRNWNFNEFAAFSFKSEKFNSRLQVNYSYSITNNNIQDQENQNVSNFGVNNTTSVKLPLDISIQNNISFTYNSGYSSDFKKTEILWNASVSKLFLKKKKGTLKVQFYDILKDRNNVTRTVTDNISDTRTNSISRYFLVSFSYRFNISKGKSDPEVDDFYY